MTTETKHTYRERIATIAAGLRAAARRQEHTDLEVEWMLRAALLEANALGAEAERDALAHLLLGPRRGVIGPCR